MQKIHFSIKYEFYAFFQLILKLSINKDYNQVTTDDISVDSGVDSFRQKSPVTHIPL